jgi:hypothetical protein
MKLVTFDSRARPARVGALLPDGAVLDLSSASGEAPAVASMLALIEAGEEAWAHARGLVADARREHVHGTGAYTLRAPLPLPAQFRDSMCFHKHIEQSFKSTMKLRAQASGDPEQVKAAEAAAAAFTVPEIYERQPVWYKGNRFNVADPGEDIPWPPFSALADFELELACVIGRRGRDLDPATALDHVFGFTIFNDFTARDIQSAEMQGMLGPAKGKDFDKANVFGPCIVTTDEIGDPNDLKMTALGERRGLVRRPLRRHALELRPVAGLDLSRRDPASRRGHRLGHRSATAAAWSTCAFSRAATWSSSRSRRSDAAQPRRHGAA